MALNQSQIDAIKENPADYYSQSQVALERNADQLSPDQLAFYNDVFSESSKYIPNTFETDRINKALPTEISDAVTSDPEKWFPILYKDYKNNTDLSPSDAEMTRAAMIKAQAEIIKKGKDPEELLKKPNLVNNALGIVSDIGSLGSNLTAGAYSLATTGKPIPIWGQGGWKQALLNNEMKYDPELEGIITKLAAGQLLDPAEEVKWNDIKNKTTGYGTALDLGADPLLAVDALIGGVSKLSKLTKLDKAAETSRVVKDTAETVKNIANTSDKITPDALSEITGTMNAILKEDMPSLDRLKIVQEMNNKLKAYEPAAGQVDTAISNGTKFIGDIESSQNSGAGKFVKGVNDKLSNAGNAIWNTNLGNSVGQIFKGQRGKFKEAFDAGRIGKEQFTSLADAFSHELQKQSTKLASVNKMKLPVATKMILDAVENPISIGQLPQKLQSEVGKIAEKITSKQDDFIIQQTIKGVDIVPMDVNADKWKELQTLYRQTAAKNPNHPTLPTIIKAMKNELVDTRELNAGTNVASALAGSSANLDVNYLSHLVTPEAKQYLKANQGTKLEDLVHDSAIATSPTSGISNERKIKNMSINEINTKSEAGTMFNGFKGKFFQEDPSKIISGYGRKAGYATEQAIINDELLKLSRTSPELFSKDVKPGYRAIELTDEAGNKAKVFAPREVADSIEQLKNFGKDTSVRKIISGYDKILSTWKGLTLTIFPSFYIRNYIGNMANSALAGLKPWDFKYYKDGMIMLLGGDLKFVSKDGRIFDRTKLLNEAQKYGLLKSGQYSADIANPNMAAKAYSFVEDHARMSLFIYKLKHGESPKAAADVVKKYLFDYGDLTATERNIFRRIIPFYTWTRKNLPLAIMNVLNPETLRTMKTARDLNSYNNDVLIDPSFQAEYAQGTPMLSISKDKKNLKENFIGLENTLPIYDVAKALRTLQGEGVDEFLALVSPFIKLPTELTFNYDTFRKKAIRTADNQTVTLGGVRMAPEIAHAMKNLRIVTTLEKTVPAVTGDQNNLSLTGNINPNPTNDAATIISVALYGKPITYNQRFSRIAAEKDAETKLYDELQAFNADLKKISTSYKGTKIPENDIRRLADWYINIVHGVEEGRKAGTITASQNNKRLLGFANSSGIKLMQFAGKYIPAEAVQ